jgi:dihydropteroate synthase
VQNTVFSTNKTLNISGRLIDLYDPTIMGVLNITPDSFFDGGRLTSEVAILNHTEKMLAEGATFIDVGGYSSRPGADDVSVQEELNRVLPAIRAIKNRFHDVIISIDTFRSTVARAAIEEGASLINDISGGELDAAMFKTVAELKVPYILMHMRGNPQNMTQQVSYENLLKEMIDFFQKKIKQLHEIGIKDIIVDPGFGFAKTREQNFELLNQLELLHILGKPLQAGLSRKSMVWKTLNISADEALNGTTSLNTLALQKGASILRVHDVKEALQVVQLFKALRQSTPHLQRF